MKNASTDQIRDAARKQGMKTLAEDGWRLVRQGITTVEEVLSVTTAKEVARHGEKSNRRIRREHRGGARINEFKCPPFSYKALQRDGKMAEGVLSAPAGPTRCGKWRRSACAR